MTSTAPAAPATPGAPVAVVVDAYSVGKHLAPVFRARGADVVHVQSTERFIPGVHPPDLTPYIDNIVAVDVESALRRLAAHRPVCVVPGQETGVPLADLLSERLGLPGNGSAQTTARRDKYEMIETLRAAGVACARQHKSGDARDIVEWAERQGEYPVVVKPLSSASADGVSICRDAADVRAAAEALLGTTDIFHRTNTEILVQSYLDGTEYVVDTVSCQGHRHLCGVWRYEKNDLGAKRIYDKETLLAPDSAPVAELAAYVDTVLAALGLRSGAAHAEVMMTAAGPVLVEIGARLNGSMDPAFHDLCLDANQADLLALSYLDPARYLRRFPGDTVYRRARHALVHNARGLQDGVVTGVDDAVLTKIQALPSVRLVLPRAAVGDRIRTTTDLLSSPLRVYLAADDPRTIRDDYDEITTLKDHVYQVAD
ncbi:ATP-grasp domain-containing protein [Streptomyces sp. H39-S7]|uniref:ATP-grasp domain-containing protein n=1 Tax=Streptomyces sp. H39-S7 TaxID=3004357 RepID=UPI0022AF0300|nr:ATP-grasp domain-containing protein [Streptomyces sp. H39-S7]MCZ4125217.1 ATP-grasp domain-containing protein [Streptomyces sp. H39-S7]